MFSATYLRQLLHYDPKTGSFTWLEKRNGVKPSQEAGCAEPGYNLGYFEDPKEAHAAYARAAKFYHREFVRTQ